MRQYVSQLDNSDELLDMLSSTYDQEDKRQNNSQIFYPGVSLYVLYNNNIAYLF